MTLELTLTLIKNFEIWVLLWSNGIAWFQSLIVSKFVVMEYTIQEKVMATSWALAFENIEESRRLFTQKHNKEAPPNRTIAYWKKKLLETGSLSHDRPRSGRPVSASGDERKDDILNAVREDSTKSTRQLSSDHDVSHATVWRILNSENFHPYKPMYSQFLSDGDDDRRLQFCEEMIAKF